MLTGADIESACSADQFDRLMNGFKCGVTLRRRLRSNAKTGWFRRRKTDPWQPCEIHAPPQRLSGSMPGAINNENDEILFSQEKLRPLRLVEQPQVARRNSGIKNDGMIFRIFNQRVHSRIAGVIVPGNQVRTLKTEVRHPACRDSTSKLDGMDQDGKLDLRVESPYLGAITISLGPKTRHAGTAHGGYSHRELSARS